MDSDPGQPRSRQAGGLQSMLDRLRGMISALRSPAGDRGDQPELLPTWDAAASKTNCETMIQPITDSEPSNSNLPSQEAPNETSTLPGSEVVAPGYGSPLDKARECPACRTERTPEQLHCAECGFVFSTSGTPAANAGEEKIARLQNRYRLGPLISQRGSVHRYRGTDHGQPDGVARPVIILVAPARAYAESIPVTLNPGDTAEMPIGDPEQETVETMEGYGGWPDLAWEKNLLVQAQHPSLPLLLDNFVLDGIEYLVEEVSTGQPLWDAWDDPQATAKQRFGWLKQVAEALQSLHRYGAILEGLHPEILVVDASGRARLIDLSDVLPLPMPPNTPVRATYYSAPELVVACEKADARADLYSFGATILALYLGRELTDLEFDHPGAPKSAIERMPDIHPLLGRLISKTFCRQIEARFPTEDAALTDPTGFDELIGTLDVCGRTLDKARLDIAAWTTTGMVRSGNEDGFVVLHALEAREDDLTEAALVLLADGMGGQESGEVAAAMAIGTARDWLLEQPCFASLGGKTAYPEPGEEMTEAALWEARRIALVASLKEANRRVYGATKDSGGRREMGCTAEAVFVGGTNLWVAHVGDSRAYHLHRGELRQLTRDQTWVNRMVDLGALSQAEADIHPRRSELLQAIGGHADVEPDVVEARLEPGDWVLVCSDGLSNYLSSETLTEMLLASGSAETACRRLVNMVNYMGALDNATVVVIRAH
jgi:serine/threonine protein phosphatase PrpC